MLHPRDAEQQSSRATNDSLFFSKEQRVHVVPTLSCIRTGFSMPVFAESACLSHGVMGSMGQETEVGLYHPCDIRGPEVAEVAHRE